MQLGQKKFLLMRHTMSYLITPSLSKLIHPVFENELFFTKLLSGYSGYWRRGWGKNFAKNISFTRISFRPYRFSDWFGVILTWKFENFSLQMSHTTSLFLASSVVRKIFQVFFVISILNSIFFSCPFDSVTVYDGRDNSSAIIGTYCGQHRNLVIYSSAENLYVTFEAIQRSANTQNRGFKAFFEFSESFVKLGVFHDFTQSSVPTFSRLM